MKTEQEIKDNKLKRKQLRDNQHSHYCPIERHPWQCYEKHILLENPLMNRNYFYSCELCIDKIISELDKIKNFWNK